MFRFFKKLREDLRLPRDSHEYMKAKKIAVGILSLAMGVSLSFGLWFTGFALLSSFVIATSAFALTLSASLFLFTNFKMDVAKWIDDHITNPPRPITLPSVQTDANKIAELKDVLEKINLAKGQPELDINTIKSQLKQLFDLRSYQLKLDDDLNQEIELFKNKFEMFKKTIQQESDWKNKANLVALKELTLDAVLLSDSLMAKIEQDIRTLRQPVTTNQVADKLTNPHEGYAQPFLYNALVSLYHFARGHAHYANSLVFRSMRSTENLPAFYQEGTIQNDVRKIYNCFFKHGFDERYGGKAFRQRLLTAEDPLFEQSTKRDSKKIRKFDAFPR